MSTRAMHWFAAAGVCLALAGGAAGQSAMPVGEEPYHKLVLENRKVRVFRVEVPGQGATGLHQHDRDYLAVFLGDSRLTTEVQGKPAERVAAHAGDVHLTKGGFAHVARNELDTPFRALAIELLQTQDEPKPAGRPQSRYCNKGSHTACVTEDYLFCNSRLCVSRAVFGPGAVSIKHGHDTDHMLVALNDYVMKDDIEREGTQQHRLKTGDVVYLRAGIKHQLTNVGSGEARLVVVVFK